MSINTTQIIEEISQLKQIQAQAKERETELNRILIDAYQNGEIQNKTTTDAGTATIVTTRRINTTKLAKAFPLAEHPDMWEAKISTKQAKHKLAPADLEAYMDASNSVKVTPAK